MRTNNNRSSRVLILIMITVVIVGVTIAKTYYGNITRSIDPRVRKARELYTRYDKYAQEGNYYTLFDLLDSIENIYTTIKHYESSFEMGVLHNNRAAALLTISMYADSIPKEYNPYFESTVDSVVSLAEISIRNAVAVYDTWLTAFLEKSPDEIIEIIEPQFVEGFEDLSQELTTEYLNARVRDIKEAIAENDKRLSVCYTNMGIVFRQRGEYKEAVQQYEKALALWDRNLNAENNLNRLLGNPIKNRNFIQKLFPPKRDQ